jgi:hypothetical protein
MTKTIFMQARFEKPEIKEVILKDNNHTFFRSVEHSNKIIISNGLIELFQYIPIISFILSNKDLLPQGSLTFALAGHGSQWHRDAKYPILGIYKPLHATRLAGTLFTKASSLCFGNLSQLNENTVTRNDYSDSGVSKLTLFSNAKMRDGSYLFHKRECKYDTESNIRNDIGSTFSIKVENATIIDEIEYD